MLFNLTMTSAGRQFDRLAMMFLGDIEVFRTSTAEPTWYGIEFKYVPTPLVEGQRIDCATRPGM